jgi:hypothetical protein
MEGPEHRVDVGRERVAEKIVSRSNQRAAKSAGSRAKGTGAPLIGSRGTDAQHMCNQSCRFISSSEPKAPSDSFDRYCGSWYCDSHTWKLLQNVSPALIAATHWP